MSAKRIATVASGVAVIVLLAAYSLGFLGEPRDTTASPQPAVARATTDRSDDAMGAADEAAAPDDEGTGAGRGTRQPLDSDVSEQSGGAGVSLSYERPLSSFEMQFGRTYADCRKRLSMDVCKQQFETRDQEWASETERRIDELVSAMPMLRLRTSNRMRLPSVECRTTWCRIQLDVDLPALIDYWRSIGQWDEKSQHKFFAATVGRGWDKDRAEELRLGLVMSGLIEDEAEVDVNAAVPAYDEQEDGFLRAFVHRCPKRYESCGPR